MEYSIPYSNMGHVEINIPPHPPLHHRKDDEIKNRQNGLMRVNPRPRLAGHTLNNMALLNSNTGWQYSNR